MVRFPWLKWLKAQLAAPQARRARTKAAFAPRVEALENREVLTGGTWAALATNAPGPINTMMLLTDGTVLADNANTNTWYKLTPNAAGSYLNGTWSTTVAPSSIERLYYGSNVLPDGRVFVLGGEYTGNSHTNNWINTGEIYDPVANTWSGITNFPQSQFGDDPTVLLNNGKILAGYLAGGQTYLYNPATNSWAATGSKLRGDRSDEETWILLPDGSVLTYDIFSAPTGTNYHAQRYVPSTGTWVDAGNVPVQLTSGALGSEMGPGTLLPDGRVFQVGANNNTAIYTPSTNTWVAGPTFTANMGADDTPGAMLPNGNFIFAADHSSPSLFTAPTQLFEFDPVANTITQLATPAGLTSTLNANPAFIDRMLVLPNGDVLLSTSSNQVWEFTPNGGPNAAWRPTLGAVVNNGANFTLTGTQLNGLSQGASYGDDAEMDSNYPVVRFTDNAGVVKYGRTFGWAPGAVATGATVVSTQFTTPNAPGAYLMAVSAAGISSDNALFVQMGTGANNVTIRIKAGSPGTVQVVQNGSTVLGEFATSSFTKIIVAGDSGNDTFTIDTSNGAVVPTLGVVYDGGGGSDQLVMNTAAANAWTFTGANAGTVNGNVTFTNVQSHTGGAGADTFTFTNGATLGGAIDGGAGADQITWAAYTSGRSVTLTGLGATDGFAGTEASVAGGFTNVDGVVGTSGAGDSLTGRNAAATWNLATGTYTSTNSLTISGFETLNGGTAADTLVGTNAGNLWALAGANGGTVAGVTFTGMENLTGGTGNDTFAFANGATVSGAIDGGAGADQITWAAYTTGRAVTLTGLGATDGFAGSEASVAGGFTNVDGVVGTSGAGDSLTGRNAAATWNLATGTYTSTNSLTISGFETLNGGTAADTLVGTNAGNLWAITATNGGTVAGVAFTGMENLTGGSGNDTFAVSNGAGVGGTIDGGAGTDGIDWSAVLTAITVGITGFGPIDGFAGTATTLGAGFTDIDGLIGGSGANTIAEAGINPTGTFSGSTASGTYTNSSRTLTLANFTFGLTLPANVVTLTRSGTYLLISGDALANAIILDMPSPGVVRVRPGANGTTFTLGTTRGVTAPQSYTGLTNLSINLGNGDNRLTFDLSATPFQFGGSIAITEGTGTQRVSTVGNNQLTVGGAFNYTATSATANLLSLANLAAAGINWQMAGTSTVTVTGAHVGTNTGSQIVTGTGADAVTIQNSSFAAAITVNTGAGDDTVNLQTVAGTSTFGGTTKFLLGDGNDVLNLATVAGAVVAFNGPLSSTYLSGQIGNALFDGGTGANARGFILGTIQGTPLFRNI